MRTKPYVIRQGDCLSRLAHAGGFDADAVWAHADNAELREKRPNPEMLHPGDILRVPRDAPRGATLRAGTENRFRGAVPSVEVKLVLRSSDDRPLADEPYRVEGAGPEPIEGTSDGGGNVAFQVPFAVRSVRLVLARQRRTLDVRIGHMDPVDEPSGVRKRLEHLGFLQSVADGAAVDVRAIHSALYAFQSLRGLPLTGAADAATRAELVAVHGS